jgi:phosphorylcholine metabolism protein LicD
MQNKSERWTKELVEVKATLDRHKVKWFLDMGTLLGAVREGDYIDWDNDIDLGVVNNDDLHGKLVKVCQGLESKGFDVAYCDKSVTILKADKVEINIAIYTEDNDIYTYTYLLPSRFSSIRHALKMLTKHKYFIHFLSKREGLIRNIFSKYGFVPLIVSILLNLIFKPLEYVSVRVDKKLLNELKKYEFNGILVNVPKRTEEYLNFRYGNDWMQPKRNWIYYKDDNSIKR